jgi:hypothetical protein
VGLGVVVASGSGGTRGWIWAVEVECGGNVLGENGGKVPKSNEHSAMPL